MKILVVGGGGREHAIIKKIKENPEVEKIYALPGNGGIAADAECYPIGAKDLDAIVSFAKEKKIDFAVVAPDDPLVLGLVDLLEAEGICCFGPTKNAAVIEGSKAFSKQLMKKYGVPTADYEIFDDYSKAKDYLSSASYPIVIKADGLALGKGVYIAKDRKEAEDALREIMLDHKFGSSGEKVVIEEYLEGPEVSVLSFTDGKTIVPMVSSMDHKRALDNDEGPNTGGMGTIAPNPFYTEEIARQCMERIFIPTVKAMNAEGRTFKGCLYFGLMITKKGPCVIEYNCRFGDPETQVVLPLLKTDLLTVMKAVSEQRLDEVKVEFEKESAACVIMASAGYPGSYEKGYEIDIPDDIYGDVYVAGASLKDGRLVTSGGRVLGVCSKAEELEDALAGAYSKVERIRFENAYYRRDIGKKAIEAVRR